MMLVSQHLTFDPTKPLPPAVEPLCNLRREIPDEVNVHAFESGAWLAYPLARGSGGTSWLGLRLVPGTQLTDSPVLEIDGAQAMTVASRPAYLVPMRLERRIRPGKDAWNEVAKLPVKTWKELVVFHHALGGEDDLDEVRKLVADKKLRAAYESSDARAAAAARFEARQRLDPSPETAVYSQYMIRAVKERAAAVPPPEAGCWNDALSSVAYFHCRADAEDDEPREADERASAWQRMHHLPGVDSARSGVSYVATLELADSVSQNLSAAKVVVKRGDKEWAKDPLYPAIERLSKTKKYDGAAHAAAAEAMAKAGDAAGAFGALVAASYWEVAGKGVAKRDTLELARKLARKAKWAQIADCLDELAEVRREVGAA